MRALVLALVLLAGCSVSPRSVGVQAELGGPTGRGAVVGPTQVLTVAHVVGNRNEVWVATSRRNRVWVRARVSRRYRAVPEDVVLLELEVSDGFFGELFGFTGFSSADAFPTRRGQAPTAVLTRRGLLAWEPCTLLPGDSGSPVLDSRGDLVGLVVGRRGRVSVYTPVKE